MHYACVLGHDYVIDACAAYYEYDAAKQLAEDVRNGVFQVVPCFGDGSHATQVGKRVTFKKRSMAHETLTISNRLETLPNRDAITKIRFLFDKEGSGPPRTTMPCISTRGFTKAGWLSKKDEGNQCFRARDIKGALIAYDASLDAAPPHTKVQRKPSPRSLATGPRATSSSTIRPRPSRTAARRRRGGVYSARSGSILMR